MNRFLTTVLLSAITVTLVSCNQPSGKIVRTNANSSQKKGQDELQVDNKFQYEFTINGCGTGKQTFNSSENLCIGLQNNTLNNNCALSLRESYFKSNCSGEFTPVSTPVALDDKEFQTVQMELNSSKLDIILTSPEGAKTESAVVFTSCFSDTIALIDTYHNGFTLLNNSKAIINRDLDYTFGDGSNASALAPRAILECQKDEDDNGENKFNSSEYTVKNLTAGNAVMVPVIVSPAKYTELKTNLTYISCIKDAEEAKVTGVNGIMLLPGARVMVTLNMNYYGNLSDIHAKVIVTCNL